MAHEKNHDYHILAPSPWPLLGAFSAFIMFFGSVLWMNDSGPWMALIGFAGVLYTMYAWWAEVVVEGNTGDHTPVVKIGLRYGVILFITSEVMFFVAWFWAFFRASLFPIADYAGGVWPPEGIETAGRLALAADQYVDPSVFRRCRNMGASRTRTRKRP